MSAPYARQTGQFDCEIVSERLRLLRGNGELRHCGTIGKRACGGEAELPLLRSVVIDEGETPPVRGQSSRERVEAV
jgi:hypothetical protein